MSGLFPALPVQVSLADQIACVERELRQRERVYRRLVAEARMTQATADQETAVMRAVLATLLRLAAERAEPA